MRWPLLVVPFAALAVTATAAPAPGHYDAQLCVATRPAAVPNCGAASVKLRSGGRIEVRVADIVYRLSLRASQLDAVTLQGRMEIDEFSAAYEWRGEVLRFSDADKNVRYEVRLARRR